MANIGSNTLLSRPLCYRLSLSLKFSTLYILLIDVIVVTICVPVGVLAIIIVFFLQKFCCNIHYCYSKHNTVYTCSSLSLLALNKTHFWQSSLIRACNVHF